MTQENTALLEALEPCPHDLGEADFDVDADEWEIARVVCKSCGAAGPWVSLRDFPSIEEAKSEAAKLWNKRPGMPNEARSQPDLFLSTDSLTADAAAVLGIDAKVEYIGFGSWWKRTIDSDIPSVTSHYFDTWMASARQCRALPLPAQAVPADVAALVVAARQIMDRGYVSTSIEEEKADAQALDKALEPFASRVCWDDEGGSLPEAHAVPCSCGLSPRRNEEGQP